MLPKRPSRMEIGVNLGQIPNNYTAVLLLAQYWHLGCCLLFVSMVINIELEYCTGEEILVLY